MLLELGYYNLGEFGSYGSYPVQKKKQLDPSDHWCGSPKPGPYIFPVDASAGCTFSELQDTIIILLGDGIALSSLGPVNLIT